MVLEDVGSNPIVHPSECGGMADAPDLGSDGSNIVGVRVSPFAYYLSRHITCEAYVVREYHYYNPKSNKAASDSIEEFQGGSNTRLTVTARILVNFRASLTAATIKYPIPQAGEVKVMVTLIV